MTCSHCIDIVLFHQLNIFNHPCLADNMSFNLIMLMAVNTVHIRGHPIYKKLRIFYLYFSKPNFRTCYAQHIAGSIFPGNDTIIQVRKFATPFQWIFYSAINSNCLYGIAAHSKFLLFTKNRFAIFILQFYQYRTSFNGIACKLPQVNRSAENTIGIACIQVAFYKKIPYT